MNPRSVAMYRTETAGAAVPAARLDTGVPILCDRQTFDLNLGDDLATGRSGTGTAFVIDLVTAKSVLIVAQFTFRWMYSVGRPYVFTSNCAVVPGSPPPDHSGQNFQGPWTYGRFPTLAEEASHPLEASVTWSGVVARPAGTLGLTPSASLRGSIGGVGDVGSMVQASCDAEIDVVIGTFSDDECLEWSSPA